MFRKTTEKLLKWKESSKALLVTGARQVGKTYLIREFLNNEYGEENYVEFNLFENENVIAQELASKGFDLYYYKNNKLGEIDFLIENKGNVIPLEIKSGKNYKRHIALDNLLESNYDIPKAYILSNKNVETYGKRIYMPIYMIMFFKKDEMQDITYKVDLSDL